jgi:hypothetical protein
MGMGNVAKMKRPESNSAKATFLTDFLISLGFYSDDSDEQLGVREKCVGKIDGDFFCGGG